MSTLTYTMEAVRVWKLRKKDRKTRRRKLRQYMRCRPGEQLGGGERAAFCRFWQDLGGTEQDESKRGNEGGGRIYG